MQKAFARFNILLHRRAFIQFKPVEFHPEDLPKFQWVFFSSPQGVRFFLQGIPKEMLQGVKTAAVGPGTAAKMRHYGLIPDYVAPEANPSDAGKTFEAVSKNEVVLFPLSNISRKSVPDCLPDHRKINVVVYETILQKPREKLTQDVLIFTSPSNARAYFQEHVLAPQQQVMAIGDTTAAELRHYCPPDKISIAAYPSEEGLWEALVE